MMEKTITVLNEEGLHARPAGLFVKAATGFKSVIEVHKNGVTKNGKSIMSVMSLGCEKGDVLILRANGEDEQQALAALTHLFETRFEAHT